MKTQSYFSRPSKGKARTCARATAGQAVCRSANKRGFNLEKAAPSCASYKLLHHRSVNVASVSFSQFFTGPEVAIFQNL